MKLENFKIIKLSNMVAAGVTEVDGTAVDMSLYEWAIFLISFGAIVTAAVTTVKAQQGTLANGSDAVDLAGTAVVVADDQDNKIVALEIARPAQALGKYVRPVVLRTVQNSTIENIVVICGNGRKRPITFDTSLVSTSKSVVSPAAGTP